MTRTETSEVGTIYTLYANESRVRIDLGRTVKMRSVNKPMGRCWFIQGPKGMIVWHAAADTQCCYEWLASNGYVADGEMPPECFEYTKS